MPLTVVGVNHATAPIEIRERFYVEPDRMADAIGDAARREGVRECVVLSTCNRTEIYLCSEDRGVGETAALLTMAHLSGLPPVEARTHLYRRHELDAVVHLFRVTSGLDSMVLGEEQIQGQVKEAYRTASRATPDRVGAYLHRLFQSALSAGGRVRSETELSEGAASIPSAAVQLGTKVFGSLRGRRALVLGAGEMGTLTLEVFLRQEIAEALVSSRTEGRTRETAERFGASAVPFERFPEVIPDVDVMVASTAAPRPVLTRERLRSVRAGVDRPLVIVDIALPRDVEPEAAELAGVFLYNIDDLQQVVRATRRARAEEAEIAEEIVRDSADEFWRWRCSREVVPLIRGIRERAERIRQEEMEEALGEIEGLTEEARDEILSASRLVLNKVLHAPTVGLRRLAAEEDGDRVLELARRLFHVREAREDDREGSGTPRPDAPEAVESGKRDMTRRKDTNGRP